MPNAIAVIAAAPRGGLLQVPDLYMEKLAIGPGYERGVVDLDAPARRECASGSRRPRASSVDKITCCVLDRPRHEKIIADLRKAGARINLISDGDVAGVINTAMPETGIDMYVGQGKAPEGVLAAAALRCVGGQMQARFAFKNEAEKYQAQRARPEGCRPPLRARRSGLGRRPLRRHRRHQGRTARRRRAATTATSSRTPW